MIEIDGSLGEGGGQVLRTCLSLSVLTGQPFHLSKIRAGREKPGLKPQHLKSIDAVAAISRAAVIGNDINSKEITFTPGTIRSGRYRFDIGTAGSSELVLQTIYLPLCKADSASSVIITGGTHVPWSPCYHYLEYQWMQFLQRLGIEFVISLEQSGFYPQGGGRIDAIIRPVEFIQALSMVERGKLLKISGISAVANLDSSIAERQKRQAIQRMQSFLKEYGNPEIRIKIFDLPSKFKGTVILLKAEYENGSGCYYSLGELGKPAERVADEAIESLMEYLISGSAVDQYLADQLLVPLSFAVQKSEFSTSKITSHLMTNAEIIRKFLDISIDIEGELGKPGKVTLEPFGS